MAKPAVLLSPRFQAALKKPGRHGFRPRGEALRTIPDSFELRHVHEGLSIRRLKKNIFECRAGLKVRLLFRKR